MTKEGSSEFQFKIAGQKHTFQASSAAERDSWVVAIEAKSSEAKAEKETITTSEGYKAELEKLTKPVAVAVVAKKAEVKKEEEEETAAPKEEAEEAAPKEEKKETAKSRSQSRKRSSIFGSLLGKLTVELRRVDPWTAAGAEAAVRAFAEREGAKLGAVAQPLRAALTGKTTSPGIFDVLAVLGRDESLARLSDQAL